MQTFDQSLFDLYTKQLITLDEALSRSSNPDEIQAPHPGHPLRLRLRREEMERQMADLSSASPASRPPVWL